MPEAERADRAGRIRGAARRVLDRDSSGPEARQLAVAALAATGPAIGGDDDAELARPGKRMSGEEDASPSTFVRRMSHRQKAVPAWLAQFQRPSSSTS